MRHGMAHRKFNRSTNQRKALLSGLAIHLVQKEKIVTTLPKAKEIRPIVERLITKGKRNAPMLAFRTIYRALRNKEAAQKIITELAPRFSQRPGGYVRILHAGFRYGDQAPMAVIEFVEGASTEKIN
jgi:large subunit ribosomal protein L17